MKCCIEKQKERNEQRKEAGLRVGELDDLVEEDEINHMDKMTQEEIGEFLDKRFDKIFKEDWRKMVVTYQFNQLSCL